MNKKYLKRAIDDDINKDDNYKKIIDKINKNNYYKMYRYAFVPVLIIIFIFSINLKINNNKNDFNKDYNTSSIIKDEININDKVKVTTSSYYDEINDYVKVNTKAKKIDKNKIIDEFNLNEMIISDNYKLTNSYALYVKNSEKDDYNLLHDYILQYANKDKTIKISISKIDKPIKDYYYDETDTNYSYINGNKILIYTSDNNYDITFKLDDNYYDIETNNVSIDELIDIIRTVIK